jgi:hypothetical protein
MLPAPVLPLRFSGVISLSIHFPDSADIRNGSDGLSLFRTRISSVSNNFKGCRGTAMHWKMRARRQGVVGDCRG